MYISIKSLQIDDKEPRNRCRFAQLADIHSYAIPLWQLQKQSICGIINTFSTYLLYN